MTRYKVVVGSTYWTLTGVNIFSANLVRDLNASGISSHVLLTEQKTRLVTIYDPFMDLPEDVPVEYLPVQPKDSWGAHWGALIRYLEELAPCVYIPNADWRHSCVSSMLSDRVVIVGVVHSDDPMHYDHVQRLGDYWNAIVTVSKTVAQKTAETNPRWANKIFTVPIGVNVPSIYPSRSPRGNGPIKIIYHGLLNQWQKRILDLPKILEELKKRGIPAFLTLAGGGNDELKLRQELRKLDLLDMVEFLGVVPHSKMLKILESQDIVILTSEFEGMPNALLEAMARGCVPVVTDVKSGIPELVKDGNNGFLVQVGDISAFADRISALQQDENLWSRMSQQAHETVKADSYNSKTMASSYKEIFDRAFDDVEKKRYRRLRGVLVPPPQESGGFKIFPLERLEKIDGVGSFPSLLDYEDFEREIAEIRKPKWKRSLSRLRNRIDQKLLSPKPVNDYRVVLSLANQEFSHVTVFSEVLVRELLKKGISAEILLTEENTDLVTTPTTNMQLAPDIPVHRLPVQKEDGWGSHWGAMVRYLESKAPCIYIPNQDWRHSCVSPLLSNRVSIVAVVHGNDSPNKDHISRLGKYFNAIVAVEPAIEKDIISINHLVAGSTLLIPYGVPIAPRLLPRDRAEGLPLNVISILTPYSCNTDVSSADHSKTGMKDLRGIVDSIGKANVPVVFTIIAPGSDPEVLMKELKPAPDLSIRVRNTIQYPELLTLFDKQDVFIWTEALQGLRSSIVDAMARGCVPIVFENSQELVRDGWNGLVMEPGNFENLSTRLADLQKHAELVQQLSQAAYQTFSKTAVWLEEMTDEYIKLFQGVLLDAKRGVFKRPKGSIFPPPAEIEGVGILPAHFAYYAKWVGPFPARSDYFDFKRQMQMLADRNLPAWFVEAKRSAKNTTKMRLNSFRTWKRNYSKRSKERMRLIRKKIRRKLSL